MTRVLITGMSGTGKSAVIEELAHRGYRAVDLDTPEWSHWVDALPGDDLTPRDGQDWVWREHRVRELLSPSDAADAADATEATDAADVADVAPGVEASSRSRRLFVSGCATNMGALFDAVDTIVLLSAPLETICERLGRRSGASYGQTPEEQRKVAELIDTVEPILRQAAHLEIDTRQPVSRTVDQILKALR